MGLMLKQGLRLFGYEVLEVEWNKVCHVLELLLGDALLGKREHVLCQRLDAFYEVGIGVVDGRHALCCAVAEEVDCSFVKVFLVGILVDDIGVDVADRLQRTVEDFGIHFHAAGVEHRNDEGVRLYLLVMKEYRYAKGFEGRNANKLDITAVANAFCHGDADAQTGVRTRTAADGYVIQRNGVVVDERQSLVDEYAELDGVVRTAVVLFVEDALSVVAHGYGADVGAGIDI